MDQYWLYALLLGLLIIAVLAFYAGKLLKQLAQQKAQAAEAEKAHQAALDKHDKKVFDSVLLITRAMQQEQCEFDEGCWRLSVLLSSLKSQSAIELPSKFAAIYGLYDAIKDHAILDARKKLGKKERMREDYQRLTAMEKYHNDVIADLDKLYLYTTEQLERLK